MSIRELVKSFPSARGRENYVRAVDGLSLEVAGGQLYTLLGPSGCGKTTTLRCVAGLDEPDAGEVRVAGRVLNSSRHGVAVAANRRGLGMVFQSYGLWPHMTVFDTVAFPLVVVPRRARRPRGEIRRRVEHTLATVRLDGLEERPATDLSGGQQQRLALARALVTEPPLLLMDEPLSNLDARLREDMGLELKRLQRELGITALYVTHDQAEALALSNLIGVMNSGRIVQVGKPREIYERPRSRFVAEFIGNANLIEGEVREVGPAGCLVSAGGQTVRARSAAGCAAGESVVVSIRPEEIELCTGPPRDAEANRWRGSVQARAFRGDSIEHVVRVGDREIRARVGAGVSLPPGTEVTVQVPAEACWLVPAPD
ncbi:MAG: ABC transporter ATP-binding protein [Solirubrobacteraceae bacterium]